MVLTYPTVNTACPTLLSNTGLCLAAALAFGRLSNCDSKPVEFSVAVFAVPLTTTGNLLNATMSNTVGKRTETQSARAAMCYTGI